MKFITKEQMEIVGLRKLWFSIAIAVILIGVAFMFINGFNFDTDFAGGISLQYDLHKTLDKAELDNIREMVNDIDGITVTSVQKSGDDSSSVIIKAADASPEVVEEVYNVLNIAYGAPVVEEEEETADETTDETADETADETTDETTDETADETADEAVEETADETADEIVEITPDETTEELETVEITYGGTEPIEVIAESRISASISNEIKRSAVVATVIAVILMLAYITVRFEFRSAIAAILCLIHDIIIVIASYAVFGIPVSSNLIAVMLTILGYSINATIILFDRVRENRKKMGRTDFGVVINISARQTLMRSINTTLTTLFTIGMIYIFGVHSIKEFALPLIVGILAGLYSSVFLSGSFWYMLSPKNKER